MTAPTPRQRFHWDARSRQYVDTRTGRFVSRATIRRVLDLALEREATGARSLALQYRAGAITLDQWRLSMRAVVKNTHLYSAALAKGGWARLTPADYGRVGQAVRFHYAHLDRFRADLEAGLPLDGRYLRRAESYAHGGRSLYEAIHRLDLSAAGAVEERNILDQRIADERHCVECPTLSELGWVPIGTLPVPGKRECRSWCYCRIEYRDGLGAVLEAA